jgi:hypothetical protein
MNDIKDAVDGEAPPVARVGGDRLGGPPPPVPPRFLQHVQAAAPSCNTNINTSKARCCGSGSGSRRAKLTHKSSGWAGRHRQLRRAFFNMCRLRPPTANTNRNTSKAQCCESGSGFNQVSGSGSVFGIQTQESKNDTKSSKKVRNIMF